MRASGETIINMVTASSSGKMAESTGASTSMTRGRARVPSHGKSRLCCCFEVCLMTKFLHRPDGRRYCGGWKASLQHGIGLYRKANGKVRMSEWVEGKRVGKWSEVTPII